MSINKNISILCLSMASGGAERVISRLLNPLSQEYSVTLVLLYDIIHYKIPQNVKIRILLPKSSLEMSPFQKIFNLFKASLKYYKFIKRNDISLSISFLTIPNLINGFLKIRSKKIITIISERAFPTITYNYRTSSKLMAKYILPFLYNKCDFLFSNSVYINKDLKESFKIKIPMTVIYNPISINEKYIKIVEDFKLVKKFDFINVGGFYRRKNHELILRALTLLEPEEFHFTHLGAGDLETDLKGLSRKLSIDKQISFIGKVSNVKHYLIRSNCFVLSSETEGFPNVLLEALSVGLPCISTNCQSGPLEMLNDNEPITIPNGGFVEAKYGILINVDDEVGLASALVFLKNNLSIQKHYSKLGIERAKEYQLSKIYNEFNTLIKRF